MATHIAMESVYFLRLLMFLLIPCTWALSTPRINPLPFQHVRRPLLAPLPIDGNGSLDDNPSRPAFQVNRTYVYNLTLNTASELYSFNYEKDHQNGSRISETDASGFSANVSSTLVIMTHSDSPEPNTLIFLAYINVPDCIIEAGNPIGEAGVRVIRNTFGSEESCLKQPGVNNQTSIWVTQDLFSGEFKTVYYNASVAADPTAVPPEDPLGYQKLVVSSLRTLQSYYNGSESYEHMTNDRFGNPRTVQYTYIGKLGDAQCWQADSTSINEDELAADTKNVCWSQAGGVSNMTGGDATELGTIEDDAQVIDKVMASSGAYATLSQNGTLEVVHADGVHTIINNSSNCPGPYMDIQQAKSGTLNRSLIGTAQTFLAITTTGQVCKFAWNGNKSEEDIYLNPPFSFLAGGPPVELPGQYRSQWALDTFGAIWETHDTSPNSTLSPQNLTWTNYTDPNDLEAGHRPVQFWPFHPTIQVQATVYGFFSTDDLTTYVLYQANGNTEPSISNFPSLNNVEEILSFLDLAPVGPNQAIPMVAGVGEDQNFYYTKWNPPHLGLINPADGFSDWMTLDLGSPAMSVEPWHFDTGSGSDDGIFITMQNSSVVSMQLDPSSQTGWGNPQFILSQSANGPFLGALDVSFDKVGNSSDPNNGRVFIGTYPDVNVTTASYKGAGVWIAEDDWQPFLNINDKPEERGFPPTTASTQASAVLAIGPTDLNSDDRKLLSQAMGNWRNFSTLPFDDPQWMHNWPLNYTDQDVQNMAQTLFTNLADPNTLIDFRRNISRGGDRATSSLCVSIEMGDILIDDPAAQRASALLGTLASSAITSDIVTLFNTILKSINEAVFPSATKIAAIQESISMNCAPAAYVHQLAAIANGSVPVPSQDIQAAASSALGAFAAKSPCPFDDNPGLEPHHIVQVLHNQTIDEDRHENLLRAVYGLANTRHPDVIDKVKDFTHHSVPALRVAAVRAIANVPNQRATSYLVYHSLHNDEPVARRAGLQALHHHIFESPTLATRKLIRGIFEPRVRRTPAELYWLKSFLQKRVSAHDADHRIARIGINRLTLVEVAIANQPPLGSSLFTPIRWAKTFGGSNVRAAVGVSVDSDFDTTGAGFHAEAFIFGSLFSTNFDIASAGAYAIWDSDGLMSFSLWTAIFIYDFQLMHQVPYYLLDIEYMGQTVFQLMQGDPCTIMTPSNPAVTIRQTKSFIRATYYYGIPLIANVNLHVELVGWFEVGYGVELVARNLTNPLPGQITGYIRPGAGVGGQISANVQVLVANAGLEGNLDFAAIYLPAGGAMVVKSLSPFGAGFGDSISLQGQFLKGQVRLYFQIWNCCCWYCWFSCCFRCGGGCNSQHDYTLFHWDGVRLPSVYIDHRPNLCSSIMSSGDVPSTRIDPQRAIMSRVDFSPLSNIPPEGLVAGQVPEDSESWCLCEGYYNPGAGMAWITGVLGWGMNDFTYLSIGTQYMLPAPDDPPDMLYDCSSRGFPELCQNTNCWLAWSPYSSSKLIFTYDDVVVNRRSKSLSALQSYPIPPGTQRDECPMNKCTQGGCCARIQAIEALENARHGGVFCGFLHREFGYAPHRPVKGRFGIDFNVNPPSSKSICKATDFRYQGGDTYKQPSIRSCWPCRKPLYAVAPGLQSFDFANITLYLAGKGHPQLSFNFGDTIELHYQPVVDRSYEVLRYSYLQNLTVGHRTLMIHGNFTTGIEKYLDLTTPGGDIFQLYIDHSLFDLNETQHSLASVHLVAEFSHLVSHPENLARQQQIESKAEVVFNVSDTTALHRLLGSPPVFKARKQQEQRPITYEAPRHKIAKDDKVPRTIGLRDLVSLETLKSHLPDVIASDFSLREIILTASLAVVSLLYLL